MYGAMTRDAAQRSIWTFYEGVIIDIGKGFVIWCEKIQMLEKPLAI